MDERQPMLDIHSFLVETAVGNGSGETFSGPTAVNDAIAGLTYSGNGWATTSLVAPPSTQYTSGMVHESNVKGGCWHHRRRRTTERQPQSRAGLQRYGRNGCEGSHIFIRSALLRLSARLVGNGRARNEIVLPAQCVLSALQMDKVSGL